MIEFKDGKKFISVKRERLSPKDALVFFSENGHQSSGLYISKGMYYLLEKAMPHIKAIVDGDVPEIFPGANEALDKIGVRKE